ncbi:hypothetical protein EYF80_028596 [Liparis tanakae]|uniref:Uncharacterized protein n=1 Tax=Liparis tanakae TaxID=230148 RepID=A0A4Z2H6C8_9TELE|nr:hypothetical protein EYF80_028596 [Liparis tanakae]
MRYVTVGTVARRCSLERGAPSDTRIGSRGLDFPECSSLFKRCMTSIGEEASTELRVARLAQPFTFTQGWTGLNLVVGDQRFLAIAHEFIG